MEDRFLCPKRLLGAYRTLTVPVVCTTVSHGGNKRHVREDGVCLTPGGAIKESNPTQITVCGMATLEDVDVDYELAVNEGNWCVECQRALKAFIGNQELFAILTTEPTILG